MKKRLGIMLLPWFFSCLLIAFPAYGGGINGNEQSVLAAAQGTFTYNGFTYRAKQSYINQLIGYLSSDDVDLTPEQAKQAIAMIYANVKSGVEGGYLEKIGAQTGPEGGPGVSGPGRSSAPAIAGSSQAGGPGAAGQETPGKSPDASQAGAPSSQEKGQPNHPQPNLSGEDGKQGAGGIQKPGAGQASQASQAQPEQAQPGQAQPGQPPADQPGENQPAQPSLSGSLPGREGPGGQAAGTGLPGADFVPREASQELKILEAIGQNQKNVEGRPLNENTKGTDQLMEGVSLPRNLVVGTMAGLSALAVLLWLFILWKKLYSHSRRRKLLAAVRWLVTGLLAVAFYLGLFSLTMWLSAFHDAAVHRSLNKTGYYDIIYNDLRQETVSTFQFLGIPEDILVDALPYDFVTLAEKQQVENDLFQGNYQADPARLTNRVRDNVVNWLKDHSVTVNQYGQQGLDLLLKRLDESYLSLLRWPFSYWWSGLHLEFVGLMKVFLPLELFLLVLAHGAILTLHHYKHRGIRRCGWSLFAASIALMVTSLLANFAGWRKLVDINPPYMKEFFHLYIKGMITTGALVGGIGLLISVGYFLLAKAVREGVK